MSIKDFGWPGGDDIDKLTTLGSAAAPCCALVLERVPDEKLKETAMSAVLKFPSRVATPDDIKFLAERLKDERYAMQKLAVDFIGRTELRLCVLSNRWR